MPNVTAGWRTFGLGLYSKSVCTFFLYMVCTGCATVEKYAPTTERPFCVPQVKVYKDAKKIYGGIRCHF